MKQYDNVWKNNNVDGHFKADTQKMLELFEQEGSARGPSGSVIRS
jgi:hypothetical protein